MRSPIYVVDATNIIQERAEKVSVLIYAPNAELAENKIRVHQQRHQLRLSYMLQPLPLAIYLQRHAEATWVEPLKAAAQSLSAENDVVIFSLNEAQMPLKVDFPCLQKIHATLREPDEQTPFLFQPVPRSVQPYLWRDDESRCYVIINAQMNAYFPSRFEELGLTFANLFKGEQGERRKASAPYLVELPLESELTEALFTAHQAGDDSYRSLQHWQSHFGFFFRSSASFDELVEHFRHFVYMPTYDERLLYFRFYDDRVIAQYLERLMYYPEKLNTFFGGNLIEGILVPDNDKFIYFAPKVDLTGYKRAKKQYDKFEMDAYRADFNRRLLEKIKTDIVESNPELLAHYSEAEIDKVVLYHYHLSEKYQLIQSSSIGLFSLITLFYGKPLDQLDEERVINKILAVDYLSKQEKQYYIMQRVDVLAGETSNQ